MSPLVAGMEAAKSWQDAACRDRPERPIENPPFWVAFDYASYDAVTGLGPSSNDGRRRCDGVGPVIQIRASPIRYGHPSKIVADLLGSQKFRADASVPKTTTSTDSGTKQQSRCHFQDRFAFPYHGDKTVRQ